jgi:hypothetical protein
MHYCLPLQVQRIANDVEGLTALLVGQSERQPSAIATASPVRTPANAARSMTAIDGQLSCLQAQVCFLTEASCGRQIPVNLNNTCEHASDYVTLSIPNTICVSMSVIL